MNPKEDQSGAMIAPAAQVHAYAPKKSRRKVILSMNNLTLRCHLGKR
jgi:hypothetical protein